MSVLRLSKVLEIFAWMHCTSLIGARTILAMGLIRVDYESVAKMDIMAEIAGCSLTKEAILERYSDVFAEPVGCLEGKLHLERDRSVTPVQMPVPQKVPLAMQELLQAELRDMEYRFFQTFCLAASSEGKELTLLNSKELSKELNSIETWSTEG